MEIDFQKVLERKQCSIKDIEFAFEETFKSLGLRNARKIDWNNQQLMIQPALTVLLHSNSNSNSNRSIIFKQPIQSLIDMKINDLNSNNEEINLENNHPIQLTSSQQRHFRYSANLDELNDQNQSNTIDSKEKNEIEQSNSIENKSNNQIDSISSIFHRILSFRFVFYFLFFQINLRKMENI